MKRICTFLCFSLLIITNNIAQLINDNFLMGKALVEKEKYRQSLPFLTNAIEQNKNQYTFFMERGLVYYELGGYNNAIHDFEKANSLRQGIASYDLARCYAKIEDKIHAVTCLEEHLSQRTKTPYYKIVKEKAFYTMLESKEWIELWNKEWYDEYERIINEAGLMMNVKEYYEAMEYINQYLPDYPEGHELYAMRATLYTHLESYLNAIEDFSKALKIKPRMAEYYNQRARLYLSINKPKKALEDYTLSLKNDPSQISTYYTLSELQYKEEMYADALQNINTYLKYNQDDKKALYQGGLINREQGNYIKALEYFNQLLKHDQSKAEYFHARGETYLLLNTPDFLDFAINDFSMALDIQPKNADTYLKRAKAFYAKGKNSEACFDIKQAEKFGSYEAGWLKEKYCGR